MPEPRSTVAGQPAQVAIGQRVKVLRLRNGMTIRQLAARLAVSPATLSAIENGHTGLSSVRLAQVAGVLQAPVEELFSAPQRGPGRPWASTSASLPTPSQEHFDPPRVASTARAPDGGNTLDWRLYPPLNLAPPLAAALSAFLEFGYHGATMRHIAQRAGLSVPGMYHYYPSKQDMLVAILDLTMEDLLVRSLAARAEGSNCVERFALLVECLALYHTHRRELGFVGASEMRSLGPKARERVAAARRMQQRMLDEEVEQASAAGAFETRRPHEAARAVVTMCTALPQWFSATGPTTAEEVAELYVEFAFDLVRCTESRRIPPARSRGAS